MLRSLYKYIRRSRIISFIVCILPQDEIHGRDSDKKLDNFLEFASGLFFQILLPIHDTELSSRYPERWIDRQRLFQSLDSFVRLTHKRQRDSLATITLGEFRNIFLD